jgi:DNA-binding NarL/FixJ family response regulator
LLISLRRSFLRKDTPPERLVAFVRSVGDGDALLDPTITRRLIERYARPHRLHAGAAGKLSELTRASARC